MPARKKPPSDKARIIKVELQNVLFLGLMNTSVVACKHDDGLSQSLVPLHSPSGM
jgi:hypothetical protein